MLRCILSGCRKSGGKALVERQFLFAAMSTKFPGVRAGGRSAFEVDIARSNEGTEDNGNIRCDGPPSKAGSRCQATASCRTSSLSAAGTAGEAREANGGMVKAPVDMWVSQ